MKKIELRNNADIYTVEKPEEKTRGGAVKYYRVLYDNTSVDIPFLSQTIPEGVNGLTTEVLIEILIDRCQDFLDGEFPNVYTRKAKEYLLNALELLEERTRVRVERGVEGKHIA